MAPRPLQNHPLRRWFTGLVEDALYAQVGLCDPGVAEYLSDLLVDFVHVDHVFALRDARGRPLQQVAEMLTDAISPPGTSDTDHRFLVHKHIGDFALFWTGVYPSNLRRLARRGERDGLLDYLAQGKRSYAIASELTDDATPPPGALLRRLSDQFETCVYGLSLVRRGWEDRDPASLSAARALWS
jgi:hypothetical protein